MISGEIEVNQFTLIRLISEAKFKKSPYRVLLRVTIYQMFELRFLGTLQMSFSKYVPNNLIERKV